jgi:hypothetical protein
VIQHRALCLLGRCSTTWATPPALSALIVFEIGSCFMPESGWTVIFLFVLPCIAGMTGMYHCAYPLIEMGSH